MLWQLRKDPFSQVTLCKMSSDCCPVHLSLKLVLAIKTIDATWSSKSKYRRWQFLEMHWTRRKPQIIADLWMRIQKRSCNENSFEFQRATVSPLNFLFFDDMSCYFHLNSGVMQPLCRFLCHSQVCIQPFRDGCPEWQTAPSLVRQWSTLWSWTISTQTHLHGSLAPPQRR